MSCFKLFNIGRYIFEYIPVPGIPYIVLFYSRWINYFDVAAEALAVTVAI